MDRSIFPFYVWFFLVPGILDPQATAKDLFSQTSSGSQQVDDVLKVLPACETLQEADSSITRCKDASPLCLLFADCCRVIVE